VPIAGTYSESLDYSGFPRNVTSQNDVDTSTSREDDAVDASSMNGAGEQGPDSTSLLRARTPGGAGRQ
jgi:hypothetical protein